MKSKKLIVLLDEGFDIDAPNIDSIEHVKLLKYFMEKQHPKISQLEGFNQIFVDNKYCIMNVVEDLSDLAEKHLNQFVVLL